MRKIWKRIAMVAICLLMLVMIVPVQSAEAANACKLITGSSAATAVFYVNTGSRWIAKKDVIKFSQTKGVMKIQERGLMGNYKYVEYPPFSDKPNGTLKMYEVYTIKVEKLDSKKNKVIGTPKTYTFDGGSSDRIKLDKNSKYRITVIPTFITFYNKCKAMTGYEWIYCENNYNPYKQSLLKQILSKKWIPLGWKTNSTWKVSSTKGIDDCAFN